MNANELRIGNLVSKDGLVYEADFITIRMAQNYKPIPLTGEWLLKFGFERIAYSSFFLPGEIVEKKTKCYWYSLKVVSEFPDLEIHIHFEHDNLITIIIDDHTKVQYIKFVHQLQNLYFALTGKELTIKI